MHYLTAANTDVGIRKKVNQDAFCLKIAETEIGEVLMAVLCDGLGGLSKGELASKTVIEGFSEWFDNRLPVLIQNNFDLVGVGQSWNTLMKEKNDKIFKYGVEHGIQLGTTVVAMLMIDGKAIICNVGDSRCYSIRSEFKQLTRDHTVVEKEVSENKITREQAENDPRSSTLTQCIGTSAAVKPDFFRIVTESDMGFLLCSDGFRHKVSEKEMLGVMQPKILFDESTMRIALLDLTELNKERGETDNITTILIKIM